MSSHQYRRQYTKKLQRQYRHPIGKKTAQNESSPTFNCVPEPDTHLVIYRVESDTDVADVTQYMHGENIPYKSVECLSNPNVKFKSFNLTVGVYKFQKLFNNHI